MTALELNAELFRQLSIIAEDEPLMRSKEEVLEGIDAGLKDMIAGRTRPANELLEELRHEL